MRSCKFPFTYKGQTFDSCTDFKASKQFLHKLISQVELQLIITELRPINNDFNTVFLFQDPDDKLWCSTKVDRSGKHVGRKGHWGYCENWKFSESCRWGGPMSELQDILDAKLGVKGMDIIRNLISRPCLCVIFKGFNRTVEH